jgi:predicted ATPase
MITKLSAKNFKCWKDTGAVRLAPITGLFGTNSSGKTSFMQLLLLLKQTTESPDRSLVLNFGDERSLVELGVYRDLVFKHETPEVLQLGLSWTFQKPLEIEDPEEPGRLLFEGSDADFEVRLVENGAGRVLVSQLAYTFAGHQLGMRRDPKGAGYALFADPSASHQAFEFKRSVGRPPSKLPAPVRCYGFPDQVRASFQNAGFLSDLELAFERLFASVHYLGPLRDYPKRQYTWAGAQPRDMGQRGEKVVDALLASRPQKTISPGKYRPKVTVEARVAQWLRDLRLIDQFSVEPVAEGSNLYNVWVRTTRGSTKVLLTDVGFGVSQILPVLTLCYYVPEGSTILMEQPEIHLHPSVQAGLADVFIDAIKTRHIQIIVESHSEHLLRRLQRRIAEEDLSSDDAALYFFEVAESRSGLVPLQLDRFGVIRNWPEGFFGDEYDDLAAITRAKARRLEGEKLG